MPEEIGSRTRTAYKSVGHTAFLVSVLITGWFAIATIFMRFGPASSRFDIILLGSVAAGIGVIFTAASSAGHLLRVPRSPSRVPATLLDQQHHRGELDDDGAMLRSIGISYSGVLASTDRLLRELAEIVPHRVFRDVRAPGGAARIGHAVAADDAVALIESVAWPPGRYAVDLDGRVRCDGEYIGQEITPLLNAATVVGPALPPGHHLTMVVVVHRTCSGLYELPPPTSNVIWTHTEDLVPALRKQLRRHGGWISRRVRGHDVGSRSTLLKSR